MIESSRAFNELYGPKPIEGRSKMNERIKELAEMSGFQFDEYNEATARKVEALGKLLVRECADLFEVEWGEGKLTDNDVGYVVKKHFGIE